MWKDEFNFEVTDEFKMPEFPAGGEAYLYPSKEFMMDQRDLDLAKENISYSDLLDGMIRIKLVWKLLMIYCF